MSTGELTWQGTVVAVQPRIRLTRSFDERSHSYPGYALRLQGQISNQDGEFLIGIGKVAQAKYQFRIGDIVSGHSVPAADPRLEPVDYYKTSGLKLIQRADIIEYSPPPWHGVSAELEEYRWRGYRRLSSRTYASKCIDCIWGCRMAVEMIVDH